MADTYERDYREAREKLEKFKQQTNDLNNAKQSGTSTKKHIYFLTATNNTLAVNMKNLERCQYQYENHSSDYSHLSEKQRKQRVSDITLLNEQYKTLSSTYADATNANSSSSHVDLEAQE